MYTHNKSSPQNTIKGYTSIYVRCSNPNGISIDTQLTACLNYAKEKNFVLQGVYSDNGVSGRQGKNLKDGELGFWKNHILNHSNLLIYSVDRLTRHLFSGLQLLNTMQEKNIDVHFVSNKIIYNNYISAMNKSSIQQELQTAEKYSNDTSEKIKGTINRLKNEGKYIPGRIPFGYKRIKINGRLKQVENSIEMDIIKIIRTKYNTIWNNYDDYSDLVGYTYRHVYFIIKYLKQWCDTQQFKDREQNYFTESKIKKFIMSKMQH
jgi:DNA invertase Pin-like site-specific DNA recombinase